MDEVERLAVGKGRGGLVLSTADEVYEGREEKHVAMGRVLPVVSFSFFSPFFWGDFFGGRRE